MTARAARNQDDIRAFALACRAAARHPTNRLPPAQKTEPVGPRFSSTFRAALTNGRRVRNQRSGARLQNYRRAQPTKPMGEFGSGACPCRFQPCRPNPCYLQQRCHPEGPEMLKPELFAAAFLQDNRHIFDQMWLLLEINKKLKRRML